MDMDMLRKGNNAVCGCMLYDTGGRERRWSWYWARCGLCHWNRA